MASSTLRCVISLCFPPFESFSYFLHNTHISFTLMPFQVPVHQGRENSVPVALPKFRGPFCHLGPLLSACVWTKHGALVDVLHFDSLSLCRVLHHWAPSGPHGPRGRDGRNPKLKEIGTDVHYTALPEARTTCKDISYLLLPLCLSVQKRSVI